MCVRLDNNSKKPNIDIHISFNLHNVNVITGFADNGIVVTADIVGVPECKMTRKGVDYQGFMNQTGYEETCQPWASQTVSIT